MKLKILVLLVSLPFTIYADTLELADGSIHEGEFIGTSNGVIMFKSGGSIEAYGQDEIVAVYFSSGVEEAMEMSAGPSPETITVPAGTRMVLRMTDTVDSSKHGPGHRFRAQLEGALVVGGVTVAPRNTYVHGRITESKQSGRAVGSSELSIQITDIMLENQLFPITTAELSAQTGNEAKKTLGRTARAAAVGGLIDGSSGAKTGAKVGAGASLLTRGSSINIPRGTMLETQLGTDLTVPTSVLD